MWDFEEGARRGAPMIAATIAAIALLVAPAAGASTLKTRSKSVTIVGQGVTGTATATCPKGTKAVGGGYASTKPAFYAVPSNLLDVYESRRTSPRRWQVSAGQLAGGPSQLVAYVYCRAGSVHEVVNTVPLAPAARSEAIATAICPSGTRAVSGGFQVPATLPGAKVIFSYVDEQELAGPRAWKVTGVRSSPDAPVAGSVAAYAYCAAVHRPGLKESTVLARTSNTAPATPTTDVVPVASTDPCTKRTTALSGGFRAPYVQGSSGRETIFVTESNRVGRTWTVSGEAFGNTGATLSLTSLGYCR